MPILPDRMSGSQVPKDSLLMKNNDIGAKSQVVNAQDERL